MIIEKNATGYPKVFFFYYYYFGEHCFFFSGRRWALLLSKREGGISQFSLNLRENKSTYHIIWWARTHSLPPTQEQKVRALSNFQIMHSLLEAPLVALIQLLLMFLKALPPSQRQGDKDKEIFLLLLTWIYKSAFTRLD